MQTSEILSLLPAPLIAVVIYLFLKYKYPNGNFHLLYKTFLLGMVGVLPVYIIDKFISNFHLDHLHSLNRTLFYSFVLTGSVFELWKFLVLRLFVYPSKQIVKKFDIIVYSIIVAAGFTAAYSVYAIFYAPAYISDLLYALTIGPVFVSIAVIMGYFVGNSLKRQFPVAEFMTGLFVAVVFQGIYRFCLLTTDTLLLYMAGGGMIITGISLAIISLRETEESN